MNKSEKEIAYFDYPITKKLKSNGELKTLENSDALFQSVKIWLCCNSRDKIRSLSGGNLSKYIGKPMDNDTANNIRSDIIYGLKYEFYPSITVVDCKVVADKNRNMWIITIAGYNSTLNIGINDYLVINNR